MDTHHLIARASFSSHTFLPFCTRPASPDPFPSLVYILVILSVTTLPSQCLYHNFPPLICPTISACAYSPKKHPAMTMPIHFSLLCNLTSSAWFLIFANNNSKRFLRLIMIAEWIANLSLLGAKKAIPICHLRSNVESSYVLQENNYITTSPSYVPGTALTDIHAELI